MWRCSLLLSAALLFPCAAASAQRPSAPRLLPEKTVAFVRVADARELAARYHETAFGQITADEQIRPFVEHLYGSLLTAFERVQDEVGASLDELLAIPQGELCIAIVLPEAGQPQLAVIVDTGDKLPVAQTLLDRGDDLLVSAGASRSTEEVEGIELVCYEARQGPARELTFFEREEVIVITSGRDLAKQLLANWNGTGDSNTLAQNRKFTSIMNRSRGLKDEPPQITWFLDPLEFATRVTQRNLAGQAGLATIKGLGLEGLKALGGGIVLATEEFDSVAQSHVLIGHPREGVLKMLALTSGELTPEDWVPDDVASYSTFHWDFQQTYDELVRLYDFFRGEGAWSNEILQRATNRVGVDVEQAIFQAAAGRVTLVSWIEKPARVNSQATLLALQLKDADAFTETLETVAQNLGDRFESASYRGIDYYRLNFPNRNRRRGRELDEELARRPEPCVTVLGDYLLASDSRKLLEEVIATKGDASRTLANELDFKLVLNKIQRQLGSATAGSISFQRPEEGFRLLYELATSPTTRDRLSEVDNPVLKALREALDEQPLPPFAEIAKYLAPGGAILTYDELGLHHIGFGLRR